MNFLISLIYLLRLPQWTKSIFVFLGVIYSASFDYLLPAVEAALAFCFVASAVYIYNDIHDLEKDKLHPHKRFRPVANNEFSILVASIILTILVFVGTGLGFLVSKNLVAILVVYLIINFFYNHWLKEIIILDALCIASGFMLRVLAGTLGIGLPLSYWLALTAIFLSLLIAFSKRRLEKQLHLWAETRLVLKIYKISVLDKLIMLSALSTLFSYSMYIFRVHKSSLCFLLTIIFVGIGLCRLLWLIKFKSNQDDPIILLCKDNLIFLTFLCFFTLSVVALSLHKP